MTTKNNKKQVTESARLAVSIVNWRTAELVIDALQTVSEEHDRYPNFDVFVVDNDSQDGSAERLERAIEENQWGGYVQLLRAKNNGGFAAGNNIVFRSALKSEKYDYILLLNPDTLVRPDAFRILVDFMDQHPKVGIAGGRSEDRDATPQICSFRFPTVLTEFSHALGLGLFDRLVRSHLSSAAPPKNQVEVDWVSGAHMIVRRAVFEDVGLMDEGYFLYYEETDFSIRAKRAGWRCWHVPESRIVHLVGQSSGISSKDHSRSRRPVYWYESRRRYFLLNHGRLYACLVDMFVMLGFGLRRFRGLLHKKSDEFPSYFVRDLLKHGAITKGRDSMAAQQVR